MSLLFMDGFDQYVSGSSLEVSRVWTSATAAFRPSTTVLRRSGVGKSVTFTASDIQGSISIPGTSLIFVGFAYYFQTGITSGRIFQLSESGTIQVSMNLSGSERSLIFYLGTATELGRTGAVWQFDCWHYIELCWYIHNSAGYVTGWLDGSKIIELTGKDTTNTAGAIANTVSFGGTLGAAGYMDDVYILDTNGSAPFNDRLGPVFIDTLYPSGAGNYTQWSVNTGNNYQAVDDPGDQDDDTTYVYTDVDGEKDSYAFGDLTAGVGNPLAVMEVMIGKKGTGGPAQSLTPFARISSSDYLGEETLALPESYIGRWKIWESNPAGGAWTGTAIDNAEFGIQYNVTTTTSA